ncbi:MAG: periplasmic heavy metal sensor [Rhodomicrobium sp.]
MSLQETLFAENRPWHGITLWSLALNLFLICGIGAFLVSSSSPKPAPYGKGGPAYQFEMLAARLPPEDASVLRMEFGERSGAIGEAHATVHRSQDRVRLALRAEPYNEAATREAMSEAEAAHLRLEKLLQDVIASAAVKMTSTGRSKLADWQPGPRRR